MGAVRGYQRVGAAAGRATLNRRRRFRVMIAKSRIFSMVAAVIAGGIASDHLSARCGPHAVQDGAARVGERNCAGPVSGGALAAAATTMAENNDPVLSLRLSLEKPSDEAATQAAERVRELGLEVAQVSARGLLISGRKSTIEFVFEAHIVIAKGAVQFQDAPKFEKLPRRTTYRAYFPKEPTYY